MLRSLFFAMLVFLTGCTLDSLRSKPLDAQSAATADPNVGAPETLTYNQNLNVDLSTMLKSPAGLYWVDLVAGQGQEAVKGSRITVEYTGWLADGRSFDSSKNAGRPLKFTLGVRQVIDGWDQGVAGMRVGGKRLLVIPPALGYGAQGNGRIPGGATLVFEVELLGVVAPN